MKNKIKKWEKISGYTFGFVRSIWNEYRCVIWFGDFPSGEVFPENQYPNNLVFKSSLWYKEKLKAIESIQSSFKLLEDDCQYDSTIEEKTVLEDFTIHPIRSFILHKEDYQNVYNLINSMKNIEHHDRAKLKSMLKEIDFWGAVKHGRTLQRDAFEQFSVVNLFLSFLFDKPLNFDDYYQEIKIAFLTTVESVFPNQHVIKTFNSISNYPLEYYYDGMWYISSSRKGKLLKKQGHPLQKLSRKDFIVLNWVQKDLK